MLRRGEGQLFVRFNQGEHGIVIWRWAVAIDVALYAALSRHAALRELFHQLIEQKLVCRGGLHQLKEQLCRRPRFLNAPNQLCRSRKRARWGIVTSGAEAYLALLCTAVPRWRIHLPGPELLRRIGHELRLLSPHGEQRIEVRIICLLSVH